MMTFKLEKPCDEWGGSRVTKGYGKRKIAGKSRLVHRLEWEAHNGPIPPGVQICHRCDNPPCREITHLFAGTAADNARDKAAKGRCPDRKGERHPMARLTEGNVSEIRSLIEEGNSQRKVAALIGISQAAVSNVVTGRTWTHI